MVNPNGALDMAEDSANHDQVRMAKQPRRAQIYQPRFLFSFLTASAPNSKCRRPVCGPQRSKMKAASGIVNWSDHLAERQLCNMPRLSESRSFLSAYVPVGEGHVSGFIGGGSDPPEPQPSESDGTIRSRARTLLRS